MSRRKGKVAEMLGVEESRTVGTVTLWRSMTGSLPSAFGEDVGI